MEHKVVSHDEWLAARQELLAKEKAFQHQCDEMSRLQRDLPWERVEKAYVFDGPDGKETLADLFAGRSQLIVYHFMLGPGWKEGCVGCSFGADHIDGANLHLAQHDVTIVAVSRAPLEEIEPFKQRMGWHFQWVSSYNSDFNFDFHVSFRQEDLAKGEVFYNYKTMTAGGEEASGLSVFYKDEERNIYHTYSTFGRGDEKTVGAYMYLDITPKGRNETERGNLTDWVRHHDKYNAEGFVDTTGRYVAEKKSDCCGKEVH